jgi:hypothetical protein
LEGDATIHTIAYRDIFDKKKAQKVLFFFAAGFAGLEDAICNWAVTGKANQKLKFQTIFSPYKGDDEHLIKVKHYAEDALRNVTVLTKAQKTVDWFTLRSFHLSATMAGILFNNTYDNKTNEEIICQLCKSWFSHSRSTAAMVIGAKNDGTRSES